MSTSKPATRQHLLQLIRNRGRVGARSPENQDALSRLAFATPAKAAVGLWQGLPALAGPWVALVLQQDSSEAAAVNWLRLIRMNQGAWVDNASDNWVALQHPHGILAAILGGALS
jgi:hypothetical protein